MPGDRLIEMFVFQIRICCSFDCVCNTLSHLNCNREIIVGTCNAEDTQAHLSIRTFVGIFYEYNMYVIRYISKFH